MATRATGEDDPRPDVTVVIPVYDALPELHATLASVVSELAPGRRELVAVDDGSTDGSGDVLDELAAQHPDVVTVVHSEPSGWAGRPRNIGVREARGRYVFFCDADDQLVEGALADMVAFADRHGSDVVLPKVVAIGRPSVRADVWASTQVVADPARLYRSLIPAKLIRRDLIVEHGLAFAEGRQPLEDGLFISEVYRAADQVSIYADRDCYLHIRRPGRKGLTKQGRTAEQGMDAIGRIITTMRTTVDDPDLADRIAADLYRRKALKRMKPHGWSRLSDVDRAEWVEEARRLAEREFPADGPAGIGRRFADLLAAVRTGSVAEVDAVVARSAATPAVREPTPTPRLRTRIVRFVRRRTPGSRRPA